MKPHYPYSIQIYRGSFGNDGRLEFSGAEDTVSGNVFRRRSKVVVAAGETIIANAQGFLEARADVRTADHLLLSAPAAVSGQRYEVMQVVSGIDHRGVVKHVGVQLRDTVSN